MQTALKPFFAMAAALAVLTACNDDDDAAGVPEVSTLPVTEITSTTAKSGGNVTGDGGAPVASRGVVWSNQAAPDLENNEGMTTDGSGHGVFVSVLSELGGGQSYYVRAYATNAAGTAYGQQIEFTTEDSVPAKGYPPGTVHCISGGAEIVEVTNPATGKTWMDRNLGASQVAVALDDSTAHGDLYQWGRFSDGHQCRNSHSMNTLSSSDTPGHGYFIIPSGPTNGDWRSTQNNNMWHGDNPVNDPCPAGFRLPTNAEWNEELQTWGSEDQEGAFGSPLKLSAGGWRTPSNDTIVLAGSIGNYWSSSVLGNGGGRVLLGFNTSIGSQSRAYGSSVRCIED